MTTLDIDINATIEGILDHATTDLETDLEVFRKNGMPQCEVREAEEGLQAIEQVRPLLLAAPDLLHACKMALREQKYGYNDCQNRCPEGVPVGWDVDVGLEEAVAKANTERG